MSIHARIDDLSAPESREIVAEHLADMQGNSPKDSVFALAIDGLREPGVMFWTAWHGDALCGCGALKALDATNGEIKTMRTREAFLRQGVASVVFDAILAEARKRGYENLFLETGTGAAFEAAHQFYLRRGFDWCGAFDDYPDTDFNVFMKKTLRDN